MILSLRTGILAVAIVLLSGCRGASVEVRPKQQKRVAPGKFDFYVIALSWSPGFCATPAGRNDDTQCGPGRRFAFVLHGLWPQYEERGWPQDCAFGERPDAALVDSMLPIMPSPKLVHHEWSKHGTCSGLPAKDYFAEATQAFRSVTIPAAYHAPIKQIMVDPDKVQRDFAASNPAFPADAFVVTCTNNGRFLQEVRACLTKELSGRPCNREVLRSACKSNEVIMRPVR